MPDNTLLAVFAGILAFAVLMQNVFFVLTFLGLRRLRKDVLPQIQKITEKTEKTFEAITDLAENVKPVTRDLADSALIVRNRVVKVDGFIEEVMEKSRLEISELEDALHDVTKRIRLAVYMLTDGVIVPVSRINAITKAVRTAAGVLFRRRGKEKSGAPSSSAASGNDAFHF